MGTLGINNGCIDSLIQMSSYPEFAVNNTYGVKAITSEVHEAALVGLNGPGGCPELINGCRALGDRLDPLQLGNNAEVNSKCLEATKICFEGVQAAYLLSGVSATETSHSVRFKDNLFTQPPPPQLSPFDLALQMPAVFPDEYSAAFYNQRWVQEDLGVPVNFTYSAPSVPPNFFYGTGDAWRRTISDLELVLEKGLNVALVYGDRDYRCNCKCFVQHPSTTINLLLADNFPIRARRRNHQSDHGLPLCVIIPLRRLRLYRRQRVIYRRSRSAARRRLLLSRL